MPLTPAQRLAALFTGNDTAHGTHGEPEHNPTKAKWEIKATARTKRGAPTIELWEQHLAGDYPLGIVAIQTNSTAQWGCIDIDEYQDDLLRLIQQINVNHYPLVPCRSKSGGLHLFLFLTSPAPAIAIITLLRDIAARIGHATAEIFPKQAQVQTERGDVGNWMIMPYFGSTYNNKLREQVGLKQTGAEQTLTEFLDVAEAARITPDQLRAFSTPANGHGRARPPSGPFSDGPPCLQILTEIGWSTNRNETLMHAGRYAKLSHPDWKSEIARYNSEYCRPPLPPEEVTTIVRSLEKKDYEYFCKKQPMASHCNSSQCHARKFGVGPSDDFPRITALRKIEGASPVWFMNVDDMALELSTEQMQRFDLFQRVALAVGNHFYPPMKQAAWGQLLNAALANVIIIEASSDLTAAGIFLAHLEDFLTNKRRGKLRDELLSGLPWEDEDEHRYYFSMKGLTTSLKRAGVRDHELGETWISKRIRDLGGDRKFLKIKEKGINVWWVPSACVSPTPTPDIRPLPSTPI
jgi:hypothetical protein